MKFDILGIRRRRQEREQKREKDYQGVLVKIDELFEETNDGIKKIIPISLSYENYVWTVHELIFTYSRKIDELIRRSLDRGIVKDASVFHEKSDIKLTELYKQKEDILESLIKKQERGV